MKQRPSFPARVDLAQFYMSRAMYPEAKAVLDLVLQDSEGIVLMIEALRKVLKRLHYPIEVMLVCVRWYAA